MYTRITTALALARFRALPWLCWIALLLPFSQAVQGADAWLDDQPEFLRVDQAFIFSAEVDEAGNVVARWAMPDGYYLYRHRFEAQARADSGLVLAEPLIAPGKSKIDEYFGAVEVYYHDATLHVPVLAGEGTQQVGISYQGCADQGLCYPPETQWVTLPVAANPNSADPQSGFYAGKGLQRVSARGVPDEEGIAEEPVAEAQGEVPDEGAEAAEDGQAATAAGLVDSATEPQESITAAVPATEEQRLAGLLAGGGLFSALLIFFLAGLGLAFTPCVLPMVPILSSIIVGEAKQITRARALSLSVAYVLGMAFTYAALGTVVGLFGASLNLQAALQSPPVLITFAIVFGLLSLSMFGFYELQLPQAWQSGLNNLGNRVGGGKHVSVLVMGALSALVVSPCVSAPLAGALIYLSTTGDALLGGGALLALGLGMGVPLLVIGASGGHLLPKAGAWMDGVKAVFGVLLLGVAIWLLERVVPAGVTLALWAALAIGSGVYLGALDLSPRQGWGQFRKAGGAFALAYGVLLLIGASSGAQDPLKPLGPLVAGSGSAHGGFVKMSSDSETGVWLAVDNLADVDRQLARAASRGEPVLLDMYADWCISCKVMERSVFPKQQVAALLGQFRLLRADVTANSAEHKALLNHYGLFGPPSMVFFAEDGSPMPEVTLQGELGADAFAGHLSAVLAASEQSVTSNVGEIVAKIR
ncbi:MAG: protein-disulfide reductase DsbD [Pseudomonadales bacterium]